MTFTLCWQYLKYLFCSNPSVFACECNMQHILQAYVYRCCIKTMKYLKLRLLGLYYSLGFALGAGSAMIGKEAAMACTVAVEETITEHYNQYVLVV